MKREVDLVSYLPLFLREYKEITAALEAENPEYMLIWEAAGRILNNQFIATADEYGISRFEALLGISPNMDDTLELRRMRVQNRWFAAVPYTKRALILKISEILGGMHNFSIQSDFENTYELILAVFSLDDSQIVELKYLLSAMVPLNIVTVIIYESPHVGSVFTGGLMFEADIIEIKQRQV